MNPTTRDYGSGVLISMPEGERASFVWHCPKCLRGYYGYLGDKARGGWGDPQWRMTGPIEAPTLEPSLGCRGLQDGSCTGHYFFREGKLVDA